MAKKLRILAAGDIHGDSKVSKKLAERAEKENADLVILCGDITSPRETKDIIKPFKDKNKKVLIIPGNHESFATIDFLANLYDIKNLHGYSIKCGDIGIFGAGGADVGLSSLSDSEIFSTLKKANSDLKGIERKIMVTHMHPASSLSELSGFEGSPAIKRAIKEFKPSILIHSHIHEAEGMEETLEGTRVINVGKKGFMIEL